MVHFHRDSCCRSVSALVASIIMCIIAGCINGDSPPFITAQVTDVYNNTRRIEHFHMLYTWEERGETPFLKGYELKSKDFIGERMIPLPNAPRTYSFSTKRIPLTDIKTLSVLLTQTGKEIIVTTRTGDRIVFTNRFPRSLKKSAETGLADFNLSVTGKVPKSGSLESVVLDINYIKNVTIVGAAGS